MGKAAQLGFQSTIFELFFAKVHRFKTTTIMYLF